MSGFENFSDFRTKVVDGGQVHRSMFRKTTAVVTTAGVWFDGSMMSGNPVTNFYASTPLKGVSLESREGLQHGQNQSPASKFLKSFTVMCSVAQTNLLLIDILAYYPFLDGDDTSVQPLDNSAMTAWPRYTDGIGVQAYVVAQGAYTGGARFQLTYTNTDSVANRTSSWVTSNVSTTAGTLISSSVATAEGYGWNIPLAPGDKGIKSVEGFQFESANGGIFCLVLCKDLGSLAIREANVPAEKDFLIDMGLGMPVIYDGAFLSFLVLPNASLAAAGIYGSLQTVWG